VHRAYGGLVRAAQLRGELGADADVEFLAEMIAGAMTTLLNNWFNDPAYPFESRAEQTARFLARAIVSTGPNAPPLFLRPSAEPVRAFPSRKSTRHVTRTR
jgi:hypothetical protein